MNLENIEKIVKKINIPDDYIEYFGKYKAKINNKYLEKLNEESKNNGKLILVTSINPTPYGEGKTTQSIGIAMALDKLGKKTMLALREPSLGPVFGVKGGAIGGGKSTIFPEDEINLHFTGDFHAITSANNLLCSVIDNHIFQGNELEIDENSIAIKRVIDMNDRALRNITINIDGKKESKMQRNTGFEITAACELMAICDLAISKDDLKNRIDNMLVAYTKDGNPLFVKDFNVTGAMLALLENAINPNLVQTIEGTPCLVHLGPFANIAHGCSSLIATKISLKIADYVVTEAGFGADLGAEKFFDIKCRIGDLKPDIAVIVITTKALKYNGGVESDNIYEKNIQALEKGIKNLEKHIENISKFGVDKIVCINKFENDFDEEIDFIQEHLKNMDIKSYISSCFSDGSKGAIDVANGIISTLEDSKTNFKLLYEKNLDLKQKIDCICKQIYGANDVRYSVVALKKIEKIQNMGYRSLPVCIAKTPSSLTDNPKIVGRPIDFCISINDVRLNSGAGFVVAYAGNIMTMPGLSKHSQYEKF